METLKLTATDREILIRILDEYFSELRGEISNTENWKYKEKLKSEQRLLEKILPQLQRQRKVDVKEVEARQACMADDIIL